MDRCPDAVSPGAGQTGESTADPHSLQLGLIELGADVVTLPRAHDFAAMHRCSQLMGSVPIAQ